MVLSSVKNRYSIDLANIFLECQLRSRLCFHDQSIDVSVDCYSMHLEKISGIFD